MTFIKYISGVFLLATTLLLHAQRFRRPADIGFWAGGSYYLGDLNSTHFKQTQFAGGIVFRKNFSRHFALNINYNGATIKGDDALSKNAWQKNRNLDFKSTIWELASKVEFNFWPYEAGRQEYSVSPYIFAGLSAFYFNPKGYYYGWVDLQPLHTEGQEKPYVLIQPAIPFGLGYKWNFKGKFTLQFEWSFRKTFTDYLDDVSTYYPDPDFLTSYYGSLSADMSNRSLDKYADTYTYAPTQRGDSKHNDWYSFIGIYLTFSIPEPPGCPSGLNF